MSFFVEITIFFLLVLLVLALLFILVRISTKTNEKIALLETLVDQQDYQIELLRKVCTALGAKLSKEEDISVKGERVASEPYDVPPNSSSQSRQQIFSPADEENELRKTQHDLMLEDVENIKIVAKR